MNQNQLPNFGRRLDLARRVRDLTVDELHSAANVSRDTYYKWKSGQRFPNPGQLENLSKKLHLPVELWARSDDDFASALGVSPADLDPAGQLGEGLDFACRDRHPDLLGPRLRGNWAAISVSVSRPGVIYRELVTVTGEVKDGYFACSVKDKYSEYRGQCFQVQATGHLLWELEKTELHNEVLLYYTSSPDNRPALLLGFTMCDAGGVATLAHFPAGAKVMMVELGRDVELAARLAVTVAEVPLRLQDRVPCCLEPADLPHWAIDAISNAPTSAHDLAAIRVTGYEGPARRGAVDDLVDSILGDPPAPPMDGQTAC